MPEFLITDHGREFVVGDLTTYVANHACLHHVIHSQSPLQQGRLERAGGSLKEDMRNICREVGIVTQDELEMALRSVVEARNRYVNRSGFSAHQRLFGPSFLGSLEVCSPMIPSTDI